MIENLFLLEKELKKKRIFKTIPADNLMKIEVITNPSARYESAGSVINIVLKIRKRRCKRKRFFKQYSE